MGLIKVDIDIKLKTLECETCGVFHAIPSVMHEMCAREGGYWHCPNGHQRGYRKGSDETALEKEIKRRQWAESNAEKHSQRADESDRKLSAQKGVNTRMKKRAKAGVCPCCTRTFKQLASHMKNKHPEFDSNEN